MNKKYIWALFACAMVAIVSMSFTKGAFPDRTGAPNQATCYSAGCHTGTGFNPSVGNASIKTNIPASGWDYGQTYNITVKVNYPGRTVFGFELMAWGHTDSVSCGTIVIDTTQGAQLIQSWSSPNKYATHKANSISGQDGTEWKFKWTAPESGNLNQSVTFYAAMVAANSNGQATGDYVFSRSLTANSQILTGIKETSLKNKFSVHPTIATDNITITCKQKDVKLEEIRLYSLSGQLVKSILIDEFTNQQVNIPITELTNGLYLVEYKTSIGSIADKFIKSN